MNKEKTQEQHKDQPRKQFKVKQLLTRQYVSMRTTEEIAVEITGDYIKKKYTAISRENPTDFWVLPCTNLQTGVQIFLVASRQVQDALADFGEFIGRKFLLKQGRYVPDYDFHIIDIYELEDNN